MFDDQILNVLRPVLAVMAFIGIVLTVILSTLAVWFDEFVENEVTYKLTITVVILTLGLFALVKML